MEPLESPFRVLLDEFLASSDNWMTALGSLESQARGRPNGHGQPASPSLQELIIKLSFALAECIKQITFELALALDLTNNTAKFA